MWISVKIKSCCCGTVSFHVCCNAPILTEKSKDHEMFLICKLFQFLYLFFCLVKNYYQVKISQACSFIFEETSSLRKVNKLRSTGLKNLFSLFLNVDLS